MPPIYRYGGIKKQKDDESGAVRLVRTASKCLARGGDDKSGCYMDLRTYPNDKYGKTSKRASHLLVPFRGNRFNILFFYAEIVFTWQTTSKNSFKRFQNH